MNTQTIPTAHVTDIRTCVGSDILLVLVSCRDLHRSHIWKLNENFRTENFNSS